VILNDKCLPEGLKDSKKLTAQKREALYAAITDSAIAYGIGEASVAEIDQLNILQASLLAMHRAVAALPIKPDEILIDGTHVPKHLDAPARAIVGGDRLVLAISAASILAKVTRDRQLLVLDQQYPQYGFAQHKGYPTAMHQAAILEHGVLPVHRRSYAPIKKILQKNSCK
jgi:ribonuclease HII